MDKTPFLSGELNYGIAFLMSLRRHPPWVVSKNQYRVNIFHSLLYSKIERNCKQVFNIMVSHFSSILIVYCN